MGKHQDAVAEMTEQIDQLNKMKAKIEKDKGQIMNEIGDVRAATEEVNRSKASAEEANLTLGDFEQNKRRLAGENADLLRQLQELDNAAGLLVKTKSALVAALDEQKAIADDEAKERVSLLAKFRNLEHECDGLKENLDEETVSKDNLARQLSKAQNESDMWRQKYGIDGVAKAEELEMSKLKLQARLSEAQCTIENLNAKLAQLEKAKA